MKNLWNEECEVEFFKTYLEQMEVKKLFNQTNDNRLLAYWPKGYDGPKATLQSRNGPIGTFTEKWVKKLLTQITDELGYYAVNHVVCEEVGLTKDSPGDVAICRTDDIVQIPHNILIIFEVKMSIVWNWELQQRTKDIKCIGNYKSHSGTPGLLRSDTMLKAIGKSINIRISSDAAATIPIVIIGNTPIMKSYHDKVDYLKQYGIIQGFCEVDPISRTE